MSSNTPFDIIIHPRRIIVRESFSLIRYKVIENVQKVFIKEFSLEFDVFAIKDVLPIRGFDRYFYGINNSSVISSDHQLQIVKFELPVTNSK